MVVTAWLLHAYLVQSVMYGGTGDISRANMALHAFLSPVRHCSSALGRSN